MNEWFKKDKPKCGDGASWPPKDFAPNIGFPESMPLGDCQQSYLFSPSAPVAGGMFHVGDPATITRCPSGFHTNDPALAAREW